MATQRGKRQRRNPQLLSTGSQFPVGVPAEEASFNSYPSIFIQVISLSFVGERKEKMKRRQEMIETHVKRKGNVSGILLNFLTAFVRFMDFSRVISVLEFFRGISAGA